MKLFYSFIYNLLGNILPLVVALVAVPVIAHHAGVERLGALAVVWALVGYFGFLDFGLSRVVTRRVALALELNNLDQELTALRGFFWWWAVPALLLIALVLLALRQLFTGYLPEGMLGHELAIGWSWIAWSIPVTLATNWLRGGLEGLQRFARVNVLRAIFGSWNYAAPALAVLYTPTLDAMIAAIVLGRVLALVAHLLVCWHTEARLLRGAAPRKIAVASLFFREGGWMTLSNVVGPLMVYVDRFVLAALVSANAVAWYVTSVEMMIRSLLIPGALAGVLFPKFAGTANAAVEQSLLALYQRSIRAVAALMLPLCVMAAALAFDAMRLWMGVEFAQNSHRVVEIVAIGIFVNSIAQLPFAWLQSGGRAKLAAQLHIAELPLYAGGLYFAVNHWGINGAAWMWTLRVLLDCLIMLVMAVRQGSRAAIIMALSGGMLIAAVGLLTGPEWGWQWRAGLAVLASVIAFGYAWLVLLNADDRNSLWGGWYAH